MAKDIRIKSTNRNIRKLDKNHIYTQNVKEKLLKQKRINKDAEENENQEINYATDKVFDVGEKVWYGANYTVKDKEGNDITANTDANGKKIVEVTYEYDNLSQEILVYVTTQTQGEYTINSYINVGQNKIETSQEITENNFFKTTPSKNFFLTR